MKVVVMTLAVLVAGGLLGVYLAGGFSPGRTQLPTIELSVPGSCDPAASSCEAVDDTEPGRRLRLRVEPGASPLRPFRVEVWLDGFESSPSEVSLSFAMADMYMGENRYLLRPAGDAWAARVILPICTTRRIDWLATISVSGGDAVVRATFPLRLGSQG